MTDIDNVVQEFWRNSSGGAADVSFHAMRRLLEIFQVCFNIILRLPLDLIHAQRLADPNGWKNFPHWKTELEHDQASLICNTLFDECRKMLDQSFSKSRDIGDLLMFLPGIVVQKSLTMRGMAVLYGMEMDSLERLVKSTIEPLKKVSSHPHYVFDDYLFTFLQDRERSQLYYCDPILQHISICRHFLSFLDGSNACDLQS